MLDPISFKDKATGICNRDLKVASKDFGDDMFASIFSHMPGVGLMVRAVSLGS